MKKYRFTIRKKTISMIIVFAMVLIAISVFFYANMIYKINKDYYFTSADNLAKTVAAVVDTEKMTVVKNSITEILSETDKKVFSDKKGTAEWNEYISGFASVSESEAYKDLIAELRKIQNENPVDCIYLSFVYSEEKGNTPENYFVYLADAAIEDACPPGCIDYVYDINREVIDNPERGFPAYITDTEEYGWLVTAGAPVHGENGEVIGYAMADISMEQVRSAQWHSVVVFFVYLVFAMLFICIVGILVVNHTLVEPIKKLTAAAKAYSTEKLKNKHSVFEKLDLKTNDEISELADSMKQIEQDVNEHIAKLVKMSEELIASTNVAKEMTVLANKDSLTGVKNKTAYDNMTAEIDKKIKNKENVSFGIVMADLNFLKMINDRFGHESGDEAIVKLSNIICKVFKHSPVFRIGGDEFVVLLQNDDYADSERLLYEINKTIRDMKNDKAGATGFAISAALGYAAYDPLKDLSTADVFKRADHNMYENKRRMKNEDNQADN